MKYTFDQLAAIDSALSVVGATPEEVTRLGDTHLIGNLLSVVRGELGFVANTYYCPPVTTSFIRRDQKGHTYVTLPEIQFSVQDCEEIQKRLRLFYVVRKDQNADNMARLLEDCPDYGARRRVVLCRLLSLQKQETSYILDYASEQGWKIPHWTVIPRLHKALSFAALEQTGFTYITMFGPDETCPEEGLRPGLNRGGPHWSLCDGSHSIERGWEIVRRTSRWDKYGAFVFEVPED